VEITITPIKESRLNLYDFNNLDFGTVFTDYMLISDYDGKTWSPLSLEPLKHIEIHPGASMLHYGQTVFEGLKAYKAEDGRINLFRLQDNLERLNKSARRMEMAEIDIESCSKGIQKFVEEQKDWVPAKNQGSLYIRPFILATEDTLRAKPSETYRFMVIACPVGFYYDHPLSIYLERHYKRAATGGVGYAKAGGNYGASFYPTLKVKDFGYDQILWTDITNDFTLEELGSANFFYLRGDTLVTPIAKDSILKGITRATVIQLAKDRGIKVSEELITAKHFEEDLFHARIKCMFATGTAASVTFVNSVTIDKNKYFVDSDKNELVSSLKDEIEKIKFLEISNHHNWNVIV
jgi:branched-chain amino acid aminotransferase